MVPSDLAQAFAATRYRVALAGQWLTLAVGGPCPAPLAAWLGGRIAWLITAYNPGAQRVAAGANAARHAKLCDWVGQHGLACLESVNVDPSHRWEDEPGLLVAGLEEGLARGIAGRLGQLAIVAVRADAPVALVWLARKQS